MLTLLNRLNPMTGRPVLQLDPEQCQPLISTLSGRWFYPVIHGRVSKEIPKKPNHPYEDLGDAFCYFVGGITPQPVIDERPLVVETEFSLDSLGGLIRGPW